MSNDPIFVSVVLPAHNEERYLTDCLTALTDQDYDTNFYEVILVDNNSTDSTKEIAQSFDVHVISEPEGPVGRVRNSGAKAAKGELLLFIDSDCVPPRGWISYATKRLANNRSLVLGGGLNLRSTPLPLEKYWLLEGKDGSILPKDLLGGSIAIDRKAFLQVGGFDETVTSGEDTKLSDTLKRNGLHVVIDRNMSVVHLGNPTDIASFFRRQVWHSENYISDIENSIKDPTFILVSLFAALTVISAYSLIISPPLFLIIFFLAAAVPMLFSIKRIFRTKNTAHLRNLHKIYLIDTLYVISRMTGIITGLCRIAWKQCKLIN